MWFYLALSLWALLVTGLVLYALRLAQASLAAADDARLVPKQVRELVDEMDTALDKLHTANARERMRRRRAQPDETEAVTEALQGQPDIQSMTKEQLRAYAARRGH